MTEEQYRKACDYVPLDSLLHRTLEADAAVLDHCRGGHHDRGGCWVVDAVLRKQ